MEKSKPGPADLFAGNPADRDRWERADLEPSQGRALLFYLAASGQAHCRDHLATLLWSEAGPSEAHHSLRTSIYRLRQALRASGAEGLLAVEGDLLGLQPGGYTCDVSQFRGWLGEGGGAGPGAGRGGLPRPIFAGFQPERRAGV